MAKSHREQLQDIAATKTATGNEEAAAKQMLANMDAHAKAGTPTTTTSKK
jgi:hypothetical protein